MVSRIGHEHVVLRRCDGVRPAKARGSQLSAVLLALVEVPLADHERRVLTRGGDSIEHNHTAVASVGDPELTVDHREPERPIEAVRCTLATAVLFDRRGIWLADHVVRGLVAPVRDAIPDQEPVVPGVGDHESVIVNSDPRGQMESVFGSATACLWTLGTGIWLAEHDGSVIVIPQRVHVGPDEHPMIAGVSTD